jgi:hypothetical protein
MVLQELQVQVYEMVLLLHVLKVTGQGTNTV